MVPTAITFLCINIVVVSCIDIHLESILNRMELFESRNIQLELEVAKLKDNERVLSEKMTRLENELNYVRSSKNDVQGFIKGQNQQKRLLLHETSKPGVAFSTFKSASFSGASFSPVTEIVYDKIECNIGNGYDNYTGSFRAPTSGTYGFTWTICAAGDGGEMGVEIVVNGRTHGATYADSETTNEEDCATGFVITNLNSGDVVFTRSNKGKPQGTIRSDSIARTTFSGWLLF